VVRARWNQKKPQMQHQKSKHKKEYTTMAKKIDELALIASSIMEKKLSRADVKNLAGKDTDDKDLEKLIADDVEKYIKDFFAKNTNVKALVLKYLTMPGVTRTDPDLQLFAMGLKKMHDTLKAAGKLPTEKDTEKDQEK
jgi:hypothetical protein